MKWWQKAGLILAPAILIVGIRGYFLWKERTAPVAVQPRYVERAMTSDDIVQPRKLYIDDLKSARALNGKTVWMKVGYEMDYYPAPGRRVDYAHPAGVLPPIQALGIEDFVTAKAPAKLASRIAHGDRQVLAVFKKPGDPKEYAVPVGYLQGSDSKFYCDDLFFYDDPHQLYKHWPADVWQAVDQHQARQGMNELQVQMALGSMQQPDSDSLGNRTVHYTLPDKTISVSFRNDKATDVKAE